MLPAAASLRNQGANKGATTAFLISTPESGVDSIAVTYALMDPLMTVIRPIAAFCTGVFGGIVENAISYKDEEYARKPIAIEEAPCHDHSHSDHKKSKTESWKKRFTNTLKFAVYEVWGGIAGWFFIGVILAGCISALIPDDFMSNWLGGGLSSMLLMLVIGIPIYICATASTPVAAALILKGVSPGAALVFLLVGPATNVASISVLVGILGKRSTLRYLLVVASMAVLFGLITDQIYNLLSLSPRAMIEAVEEVLPFGIKLYSTFLLLFLSALSFWFSFKKKQQKKKEKTTTFHSDFPKL